VIGRGSTSLTQLVSSAGLTSEQIAEVEALAARLADAVGVRRIGTTFDLQEAVSGLKTHGEGFLADLVPGGLPGRRRAGSACPAFGRHLGQIAYRSEDVGERAKGIEPS